MLTSLSKCCAFALWSVVGVVIAQASANRASADDLYSWHSMVPGDFCMDVRGASHENRADIIIYQCHDGENQRFIMNFDDSGDYFSLIAPYSHKCVDVRGASTEDGAEVIQFDCNGQDNQKFYLVAHNEGESFTIRAKHSGKCLDVRGSSGWGNGTQVIQWPCHESRNQLWY